MEKLVIMALLALMSFQAYSMEIFRVTKSIRKKNIITYDVKVQDCQMTEKPLSAYWILGEKNGVTQKLTSKEVRKFKPKILRENGDELRFKLPIFDEINNPIAENPILVKLVNCGPKAYLKHKDEEIELCEIYAKINILKMGVSYLTIKGYKSDGSTFTYTIKP